MESKKIKAYYRVSEFQQSVLDSRDKVFERGFDVGFHSAKKYLSYKKGTTSYCYASAFSGKTSYIFDSYMHITKTKGVKIVIFSPEAGGRESVVSYLVQVYLGKKLHGHDAQTATDAEWLEALAHIDEHYIILAPKVVGADAINFTTKEMFSQVYAAMKDYGWEIDILLIDTHSMLRKDEDERRKSVADYILDNLYYINHVAESMNIHIQIAMHTSKTDTVIDKDSGIEFLPKPHPTRIANGENVFRTGQTMFGLWRCPNGVIEKSTGVPYPENATDFLVQKSKIFGVGQVGSFRLYYDDNKQKFYEIIDGKKYYCGEYEEQQKLATPTNNMPTSKLF